MSNEGTPFGFGRPGFEKRGKEPIQEEGTFKLPGFSDEEMKNLSRVLAQAPFPDLAEPTHPVYALLTPEERNTLRAASQYEKNREAEIRILKVLGEKYDQWLDDTA